jgi:hypothetical protein
VSVVGAAMFVGVRQYRARNEERTRDGVTASGRLRPWWEVLEVTGSWDTPKRVEDAEGDRDPKVLFSAVGEALTEWENVEAECAELFGVLV